MKVLTVIFVFCIVGGSYGSTVNLNEAVDQLLIGLRASIVAEGKDQVTIPNVEKDWKERIAKFIKVSCSFTCDGGWARRLSSLKRTGDVTMTTSGNRATLKFSMGLEELRAHYDRCRFHAKRIGSMSSKVEMSTSDASIDAQITLLHEGNGCKLSVDHIYVSNLGKIKFDTGGGVFHKIESKVLEILANHFKDKIKTNIDNQLQSSASKAASKADKICSKIPF